MTKKITFLGIETSCDETAAAVIRENDKGTADILSNIVSSQIEELRAQLDNWMIQINDNVDLSEKELIEIITK